MSNAEDRRSAARDKAATEESLTARVAKAYDGCHPGDSFEDLEKRARFSKQDRRLMEDWIAAVRSRHQSGARPAA